MTGVAKIVGRPTTVKVYGAEHSLGQYLVAKLLKLGYNVVLDGKYKNTQPYNTGKFYHLYWYVENEKTEFGADFTFEATANSIKYKDLEFIPKQSREDYVLETELIEYVIYCWGLHRGGRCPHPSGTVLVSFDQIKQWDLERLI